ncbi:MAG: S41 family peptidase, partial [Solirubrobacteraceae bacterium]
MSSQTPHERVTEAPLEEGGGGSVSEGPRARRGSGEVWAVRAASLAFGVIVLFCGVWLGGHPQELPGFMREAFEANHQVEVTDEAIDSVAQDYYRHLSKAQLASASIAGMVGSLDDPFSHYLDPAEYSGFAHPGTFSGVGMVAIGHPGGLLIERVFDSSPAQRAGIQAG